MVVSVEAVERTLRAAFERGEFSVLGALYAADARLDASLQGERTRASGPAEIVAALDSRLDGPGRFVEWSSNLHPEGIELWMERLGEDGSVVRQRQYLHVRGGAIQRHWIYASRPRTPPPGADDAAAAAFDPGLIDSLGEVVEHGPLVSRGWSGNALERVVLADGRRLVAKRIVPRLNWLERVSDDRGREALLFRDGVLDRMPPEIDHTIVAAASDGDAWWIVMRDVSDLVLPDDRRISREEGRRLLECVNLMWEEFWGETVPHLGDQQARIAAASPTVAEVERDGIDLLPKQFEAFWEAFAEAVEPDVADPVLAILGDPAPLADELEACGTTMIHGDLRDEQLGITDDGLIVLDWGVATQGHPALDFAWYLAHDAWRTDATHEEIENDFRGARGERDDPRALELGMIAGLAMYGWIFGHSAAYHPDPAEREWARGELDWWVPRVRQALENWSPA